MSKFCGNCGAKLDDAAKVCGSCGTPLETGKTTAASIPGIEYADPEKKAKTKKRMKWILGVAVVIVVAVIAINIVSGFVGYKGAVRKIMNAYEDYDVEAIVAMSSDMYFYRSDDSYADEYFGGIIADDLNNFENQVGHKYKISYEITDSYEMAKHNYEDLLNSLSQYGDFDADTISKIRLVELDVTAKGEERMTTHVVLTLTKENGSWKILYIS